MHSPESQDYLLAKRIDRLTQTTALVGFLGLLVMGLLIFYDGAARYLGVPRISGFSDYSEVVFPIVIASCFPAGLLRQTNVTVRVLGKLLGPRGNAWLEVLAALVTAVFFAILSWQLIKLTLQYGDAGRTTRTVAIALAPWWWITTGLMAICVPVQLYVLVSWMRAAIGGSQPAMRQLADESETKL